MDSLKTLLNGIKTKFDVVETKFSEYITGKEANRLFQKKSDAFSGKWGDVKDKPQFSQVSTSGNYNDLLNKPELSDVATSGDYASLSNKPRLIEYRSGWIESSIFGSGGWNSVTYKDNADQKSMFIAVKNSDKAAYSEDGINWIETSMPSYDYWISGDCHDALGKVVAVVKNSDKAAYTKDGINWVEASMPENRAWSAVISSFPDVVAIAEGSDKVVYSYTVDGLNWIETSMPANRDWSAITIGSGAAKFVAVAKQSNKAAYCPDYTPDRWLEMSMPAYRSWSAVTYGNGVYVAVATNSDKAAYSEDGINWIETSMPSYEDWISVVYGRGQFIATTRYANAASSVDGINWIEINIPSHQFNPGWNDITCNDDRFVVISSRHNLTAYSTDRLFFNGCDITDNISKSVTDEHINKLIDDKLDALGTLEDTVSEVDRLKSILEQNGIPYEKGADLND